MIQEQQSVAHKEREEHRRQRVWRERKEAESRELAKGPVDLPFLLLVLLLTALGLIMLVSASFPRAYYQRGKPA